MERPGSPFHVERPSGGAPPDPALASLLSAALADVGLPEPPASRDAVADGLARLAELLAAWASRMNLTGQRSADALARGVLLDAIALATALPPAATVADLGSGAGLPGLPLALLRPGARFTLVEARERRHHFQRAAIRALDLRNVDPRLGRAEQLEPTPHALVLAQAMARPADAIPWMLPWAEPGGWLAIPGSEANPPDPGSHPLLEPAEVRTIRLPLGERRRTLWMARRRAA